MTFIRWNQEIDSTNESNELCLLSTSNDMSNHWRNFQNAEGNDRFSDLLTRCVSRCFRAVVCLFIVATTVENHSFSIPASICHGKVANCSSCWSTYRSRWMLGAAASFIVAELSYPLHWLTRKSRYGHLPWAFDQRVRSFCVHDLMIWFDLIWTWSSLLLDVRVLLRWSQWLDQPCPCSNGLCYVVLSLFLSCRLCANLREEFYSRRGVQWHHWGGRANI